MKHTKRSPARRSIFAAAKIASTNNRAEPSHALEPRARSTRQSPPAGRGDRISKACALDRTIAEWCLRVSATLRSMDPHQRKKTFDRGDVRGGEGRGLWPIGPLVPSRNETVPIQSLRTQQPPTRTSHRRKSLQLQNLSRLLTLPNHYVPRWSIEVAGTAEALPGHTNPLKLQCYAMR
jgi:hypothetical protein